MVRDNSWVRETFWWRPLCGVEECGEGSFFVVAWDTF